jgi:hypothetical protein
MWPSVYSNYFRSPSDTRSTWAPASRRKGIVAISYEIDSRGEAARFVVTQGYIIHRDPDNFIQCSKSKDVSAAAPQGIKIMFQGSIHICIVSESKCRDIVTAATKCQTKTVTEGTDNICRGQCFMLV